MATFEGRLLSGSTNGQPIKVTATTYPGVVVHTAVSGTSSIDYISLTASNQHSADVRLWFTWGDTPTASMAFDVPTLDGKYVVTDREPLQNSLIVRTYADVANVVYVNGRVIRQG